MTQFQKVKDFNVAFGVTMFDNFSTNLITENRDLAKLRFHLIEEEVCELDEAIKNNDFIETIDALADILYVVWGAGVSFGIDMDEEYKNFLNSMNHTFDFKNLSFFQNTKLINDTCTRETDNTNMIAIFKYNFCIQRGFNLPDNITNNKKDMDNLANNLCWLIYRVYKFAELKNIDIDKAFNIVHDSNMSKLCSTEQLAIETVQWYKDNNTTYDTPSYRKSDLGDYYVVYNKSTGKILKSIKYTPAKFDVLLEK